MPLASTARVHIAYRQPLLITRLRFEGAIPPPLLYQPVSLR